MNWMSFSIWARALRRSSLTTVAAFLTVAAALSGNAVEAATLPVPCAPGICAPQFKTPGMTAPPAGFVTSGAATAVSNGSTLTVNQTTDQAILNWQSFNISADGKVIFNQPSSTAIALNKIYQASPSAIFGSLTANGQVYLINPNGFVFGASSSVNVAGLVASSLGMTKGDDELTSGILAPSKQSNPGSAFSSDGRTYITDSSGNPILDATGKHQPVQITVQPGARMNATDPNGGRILLAAQNVTNGGTLSAPGGQVALAAGQSLYLAGSTDPSMRGLIVEVSGNTPCAGADPCLPTGTTTNQAGATLSAPRGNVSLAGLAVNQNGRISATTAVAANGSVILTAGEFLAPTGANSCKTGVICNNEGGTLNIGSSSQIDVLPDLSDTTPAVVGQKQIQSTIQLSGQQIDIGGEITAPGGTLNAVAAANPDRGLVTNGNSAAQIRVEAGTNIDLHGSNASVPMSSNLVTIQLRSNELADDPLQRGGPLQAQTVIVDVRNGKPAIISEDSWQSALQAIPQTILQRTSAGGSASFQSEGDVVMAKGSSIDVSGGKWTYAPGVSQTTQLIGANGKLYDISSADPNILYKGVLNPTYTVNYNGFGVQITNPTPGLGHVSPGYFQGFSAGTVTFAAPAMSLQGSLTGKAVNGLYQRDPTKIPAESLTGYLAKNVTGGNGIARGGTLVIGESTPIPDPNTSLPDFFAPGVTFSNNIPPLAIADGAPLPRQTTLLSSSYITDGGFTQTQIFSDATVTLPAGMPLNLGAGGSLQVEAARISVASDIQALGGSISLLSAETATSALPGAGRLGIDIASGVTFDVRGQWSNDSPLLGVSTPGVLYQNGGSISLSLNPGNSPTTSGGELIIGDNVSFRASGGAWLRANNTLVGGTGGSIIIDASPYQSALQTGNNISLDAFGVEGASGGTFSLAAPRISVSQGDSWTSAQRVDDLPVLSLTDPTAPATAPGGVFGVGSSLFSKYGFANISLTATAPLAVDADDRNVLTIASGTTINAQAQTLMLNPGYLTRSGGGTVTGFAQAQLLPEYNRKPMSLIFQVIAPLGAPASIDIGDLHLEAGASINADALSSIRLVSQGSLLIDGVVRAAGGSIVAQIDPPNTVNDHGFLPDQRLELGARGVLDVSGTTLLKPNTQNLRLGNVLAGGSVSLIANRGEIVADNGSLINVAGASAPLDVSVIGGTGGYRHIAVGSAGGSILARSVESISLLGSLEAHAGAGDAGTLAGGTLEVDVNPISMHPVGGGGFENPPSAAPATIELVSGSVGTAPSASYGNIARLSTTQVAASGIDFLKLQADNTIALNNSAPLTMRGSISLDAPNISVGFGVSSVLNAPYVSITDTNTAIVTPATALGGAGSLAVNAQQIALSGLISLQGVGSATFNSSGDVVFQPVSAIQLNGTLAVAGDLAINAERIFPATQTSFTIADSATSGHVVFGSTLPAGQSPASLSTPFSVAGSLTVNASNISSSGTIMAPFGVISFNATDSLSLLDGSLTSVSADGATLLYGHTVLGQTQWVYTPGNSTIVINGVPTRAVNLNAPNVSFAKNATIDVSGGGELSTYEWVPGTGGKVDSLGQAAAAAAGLYAVVPSMMGQYAPYDIQEFTGSNVKPGASVYLSGGQGLAAGTYALLPARFALLPGAYLVQVQPGFQSLQSGTIGALTDGTPVTAGYLTFGNTGLQSSSGYIGFSIRPGSYSQQLAQYELSTATDFFSAAAAAAGKHTVTLPADAGSLLFAASHSLNAFGKVNSAAGKNGAAATIEISSADLTVTPADGQAAVTGVSIGAPTISSWKAGNLILGGQRSLDGTSVSVTADEVTIGSGAQVSAGQVLAVANQSIEVQSGATVASTSGLSGTAPTTVPKETELTLKTADGTATNSGAALLAVSDIAAPVRAAGSGPVTGGATVSVDSGATLSTRGAVSLDAPQSVIVDGTINAPGASWSLASNSIGFVGSGTSTDSLQINSSLLAQMQTAGALRLASADAINLQTAVSLGVNGSGAPALGSLHLIANSINNVTGDSSIFGARTVTLEGLGTSPPPAPTTGAGALSFTASTFNVGPGNLNINGNSQTTVQASTAVVGQGVGSLAAGGNLTLSTPVVTAESHAETTIAVPDGTLTVQQSGTAPAVSSLTGSLGGHLSLAANQIQDSGSIIVPGGSISLTVKPGADGTSTASSINVESGAVIDASGISVSAGDQVRGSAGGIVNLTATGAVTLASNSSINVSGAGKAPAGFLSISGGGAVTLDGSLTGNAAADASGGSFWLSAGQLTGGLSPLAANLTAGGFTNLIDVRVQNGDLNLTAAGTLNANQVNLTADSGVIDIAGTINAPSGGQRGSIGLFAGNGLVLESTGKLLANGTKADGRGGQVELSTVNGLINLNNGSVISVGGPAQPGSLLLRAPAVVSTGDIGIGNYAANITGVDQIILEPVLPTYRDGGDFTQNFAQIQTDVTSFLALANSALADRFKMPLTGTIPPPPGTTGPTLLVQAGVVVQQTGDLSLGSALDLASLGLGGPIDLTVRATGNINIGASISDGVAGSVLTTPSSSLRFVAGADLASANPLATKAGTAANLELSTGARVRTGTGDINLVASGNVQIDTGASAYTIGRILTDEEGKVLTPAISANFQGGPKPIYFLGNGGNLLVNAGNDVIGFDQLDPQAPSNWQARGVKNGLGFYGLNLAAFDQDPWSIASLGGGDVRITAGHDVTNVSAAASDSLALLNTTQTHYNSGGFSLHAGQDVTSGQFFVANGVGTLSAGRSFAGNLGGTDGNPLVGSVFEIETAQVSLWAQGDVLVTSVFNPTTVLQPLARGSGANTSFFYTYGADSAFNAQSTGGTISFHPSGDVGSSVGLLVGPAVLTGNLVPFNINPASLSLTSLTGDVSAQASLFPSNTGQLQIFAGRDFIAPVQTSIYISDAPDAAIATVTNPGNVGALNLLGEGNNGYGFSSDRHVNDSLPASVVAGRDILNLQLSVPKAGRIEAGRDIVGLTYHGQNLHSDDLTLISAGRDFTDPPAFGNDGTIITTSSNVVEVGGSGRLDLLAGRNIDLGFSTGVNTVGDLSNPNLNVAHGADITMLAGLGHDPDYAKFLTDIIEKSPTDEQMLVAYVEKVSNKSKLSLDDAEKAFATFSADLQRPLINQVFFSELDRSGIEARKPNGPGYKNGYAAIDALFPGSRNVAPGSAADPYDGSLNLTYSQVYSIAGGNISLLVPGGSLNVGLASPPSGSGTIKPPSQLGIVAQGYGDVNIYSKSDVNVNSSRIFTLGGGNIVIWSNEGNIDAGNGAKTSLSLPPPTFAVDDKGNQVLVFNAAVAGSGIRTISTGADQPLGNVNLIAPIGAVDAGDAGIGAAGNINVAAATVIGASNINFGGTATGVPPAVSNVTASVSGAVSAASASTTSVSSMDAFNNKDQAAPLAASALSWLDVFVTGLGEEDCKPTDEECIKRQRK